MVPHTFLLFVAGDGDLGLRARTNFEATVLPALARIGAGSSDISLDVIDILTAPDVAREFGVVTTPMLIRTSPSPAVRLLGTLEQADVVLELLELPPESDRPE